MKRDHPTVPPDSTALPRIVAVGRYGVGQVLQRLAAEMADQARIELLSASFEDAVEQVQALDAADPIDALVAAGASGAWIREHVALPVAMVEVRGFDLMKALSRARAISPKVGLVSFEAPSADLARLNALFDMGIAQFHYRGLGDAPACVAALQAAGVGAVVAPGLVSELAEQAGIGAVLMYSEESVRQALQDALHLARVRRAERSRHARLDTFVSRLQDGVVAVDAQQRIEALNPVMADLLGASAAALIGRPLHEVAPALSLGDTLPLAPEPSEEVVQLGARTLLLRRAPIVEAGQVTGTLLVCRDPASIQQADRHLRASPRQRGTGLRYTLDAFAGQSAAAQQVRALAAMCAASEATVLITGESGTGKEMLAQGIHAASRRAAQPFLAVNCAALSESLLESELFGHEEGAFTGARRGGKAGLVEAAHTGTLFLDEVGDMPLALQTRLLRVLQEREVLRLGATVAVRVDLRVIAATHADLPALVAQGRFRQDLYYRLAVLRLRTPPLRERLTDVPALARAMLARHQARHLAQGEPALPASRAEALLRPLLDWTAHYPWPGNARELDNFIERLLACQAHLWHQGRVDAARLADLFPECLPDMPATARQAAALSVRRATAAREAQETLQALQGDQAATCQALGISRATLWRRLRDASIVG